MNNSIETLTGKKWKGVYSCSGGCDHLKRGKLQREKWGKREKK